MLAWSLDSQSCHPCFFFSHETGKVPRESCTMFTQWDQQLWWLYNTTLDLESSASWSRRFWEPTPGSICFLESSKVLLQYSKHDQTVPKIPSLIYFEIAQFAPLRWTSRRRAHFRESVMEKYAPTFLDRVRNSHGWDIFRIRENFRHNWELSLHRYGWRFRARLISIHGRRNCWYAFVALLCMQFVYAWENVLWLFQANSRNWQTLLLCGVF